jgi:WD40 repeat protein
MDVAFSPDGQLLYSAGDSTVRVWHVGLGVEIDRIEAHRTDVTLQGTTALLPMGPDLVVSSAQDGTLLFFRSGKVDRKQALSVTGSLSNDRVCRSSLRVVPVMPYPPADSVWAPEDACKDKEQAPGAAAR